MSLLDNRKHLTPRESMETLVKYARSQDSAIISRNIRSIRGGLLVNALFLGAISGYVTYVLHIIFEHFTVGYWPSIYPQSVLLGAIQTMYLKKREFFTPEIYLKDHERWNRDLRAHEIGAIQAEPEQE